jgi:nonsense-mediated mRNA decay protein 3
MIIAATRYEDGGSTMKYEVRLIALLMFVIRFNRLSMLFKDMSGLICPKCGKSSDEKDFIEAFCVDCYPLNIKCPTKLEIEQCGKCEKIRITGEWMPFSRQKISEFVTSKCKGEFTEGNYDLDSQTAEFIIVKDGNTARMSRSIIVEIKTSLCRYCSRASGGYYQGIIQLRGNPKKVEKYADMLVKKLSKITFITKEEEKHGGLDLYVGNSKAIIGLLSEMKINATITRKLAGLEQGKRFYRTTFLIRFR